MKVEFLTLPSGRRPAEEFFKELDDKTLAKIYKLIERLASERRLQFPHARKLEGHKGLWEIRLLSKMGAVRVFYVYWKQEMILLVSGFLKKSQKTPIREIERAINYLIQAGVIL